MASLQIAGTDQTSKKEPFDYFCSALYFGCLISSSYATAFLPTFSHVVFSGLTITGTSKMDSFSDYNQRFFFTQYSYISCQRIDSFPGCKHFLLAFIVN